MKRNQYILSFLLLLVSAFNLMPANAQQNQYAIYNYRNDGNFNAWLNIDVDSITYSCIDTLGVEHDDVVVQEVWTPDSVYRIPISAIDSLGFHAPEPEYRDNVFHITEEHLPYIIAVDDYSITFSTSLPQSLRPQIGQTIVSDTFEEPLEDGFAGIVEKMNTNGNELVILCGQASITDVFKKFVIVGKAVSENPANSSKAAPRKGWFDDPWITVEQQGIKQIDIPTDLELEILGGVFKVKSKDPQLTLSYYFYLDDVIYSFSADAFLNHKDLSFTTAFKLSDFMKVAESSSEFLTNYILGKGDEEKAEEKWYEHEFDDIKLKIPFNVGPVNFAVELAPVFKLSGDVELDIINKTSARQHIGFKKAGYTAVLVANPFISLALGDMSYNYVQDPVRTQQLTAKIKGSATMGISLQLKANLISKNVVHAAVGAEYDRKLSGTLQFNLYDTEQQPSSFYDVIKDSKIEVEDYIKIKGEIGISPLKFLSLSGSIKIPIKEWGKYYLVPHFTKPELPTYSMGHWTYKNPLSLYSTVSKDVLIECKPGLKIVDTEGNLVKEYTSTEPYQYEVAWTHTPLEMNLENLTPNTTYTCYPTFNMFDLKTFAASPSYEFTVPYPVSIENTSVTLNPDEVRQIPFTGGWGDYKIIDGDNKVATASLEAPEGFDTGNSAPGGGSGTDWDNDTHCLYILGKEVGETTITLKDLRSNETTTLNVTVSDEVIPDLTLSETSVTLQKDDRATVMITSGSGSYTLENSDAEVVVAAISNGDEILMAGLKAGTATVIVTDTKSGQTATIEVTVTEEATDNLTLSETSVTLQKGDRATVTITSGSGSYTLENSNEEAVSAAIANTSQIVIVGQKAGTATITVTDTKSGQKATIAVTVTDGSNVSPGEAIDLGLPSGTLWASCNVGATKPEEYGDYFAWGETSPKENYSWGTYKWCNGTQHSMNKYCYDSAYGIIDNKILLDADDDVAFIAWGSQWRMPTKQDQDELRENCDWEWTTYKGVTGMKVKSRKNNSFIFLPASGYRSGTETFSLTVYGYYQSSSLDLENSDDSYYFYFNSAGHYWQDFSTTVGRDVGFSVRPVRR